MKTFGFDRAELLFLITGGLKDNDSISLVDYNWLRSNEKESCTLDPTQCIVIGHDVSDDEVLKFLIEKNFRNFIQTKKERLKWAVGFASEMIIHAQYTQEHLVTSFFQGQEVSRNFSVDFTSSKDRAIVLNQLQKFLKTVPRIDTIQESVMIQASELVMNAVFSAPTSDLNQPLNQLAKRDSEAHLTAGKTATLFAFASKEQFLLGCKDPYGSLHVTDLLKKVKNCISQGVSESINFGDGGAGIGSYMIFQRSKSYLVMVDPGVSTIVCSGFPMGLSLRALEAEPRNIQLIFKTNETVT